MHSSQAEPSRWVDRVRALAPLVHEHRTALAHRGELPASLLETLREARLFRLGVPRALDGEELPLPAILETIEAASELDGSFGWSLMIGLSGGFSAPLFDPTVAREAFGDPSAIVVGSFNMVRGPALAVPVEGGFRLTGRWGFGSGCQQATWLGGACLVMDPDGPRRIDGAPDVHLALLQRDAIEVHDTWKVSGLRGTGSHEFSVKDAFVPAGRIFSLPRTTPKDPGALYRIPLTTTLSALLPPVALGIARTAVDSVRELAGAKAPAGTQTLLRDRPVVQADFARAEAALRSARAYFYSAVNQVWSTAEAGTPISLADRGDLRLATIAAVEGAARAVDLAWQLGGATSIYESHPIEACFRDIHVATQHALCATSNYEFVGRVLLGLDPGMGRL